MNKKVLLSGLFVLALLATAGYGVNQKVKSNAYLSDLALANVEALAQTETSDEFYQATGCYASIEYHRCTGNNGLTYSYAWRP
jgi:hypothetical protein